MKKAKHKLVPIPEKDVDLEGEALDILEADVWPFQGYDRVAGQWPPKLTDKRR